MMTVWEASGEGPALYQGETPSLFYARWKKVLVQTPSVFVALLHLSHYNLSHLSLIIWLLSGGLL